MGLRRFGVVRPYEDYMRVKVFSFLESLGYTHEDGWVVPPGTSDEKAASWVERHALDLLLLPYHKHRCVEGPFVDGVGVALLLSEDFAENAIPIVMPTTDFSMTVSFDRRFAELREKRPEVAERVIVIPEANIGDPEIAARIREIAAI